MSFVLRMAWRDSRASRGRLFLAACSIVLGIAALVAVGSLAANLRRAVDLQAKQLLGADLQVGSSSPLPADVDKYLAEQGGELAHGVTFTSMLRMPSSGGHVRLVAVHAIEGGYPFYGNLLTEPAGAAARLRTDLSAAVLEDTLMLQFGVKVGDPVKLGKSVFRVEGALKKLPSEEGLGSFFAPRVFVPLKAIPATGLLQLGSIARYEAFLKLPEDADAGKIADELRKRFPEARLGIDTVERRQQRLGRTMRNVDSFLSLVGYVSLLLGAIGVASSVQVYVRHKLATIAVLRCLGATARQAFAVYLVQGLALGVVGAVLGAGLGVAVQQILPALFGHLLPVPVDFFIAWPAVARGAAAGLLICVLFSLLPLLSARLVPPLAVLRSELAEGALRRDPWRAALLALIAVAVVLLSAALASRPAVGVAFAAALGGCLAVLAGVAKVVIWAVRRFFPRKAPYTWRQGLANLYRPNNRTLLLLVSLGLGAGLMLTLVLTRATLLGQFHSDRVGSSNLIFFDIQDDEIGPLKALLQARGTAVNVSAPVVTMRLSSLKGVPVSKLLEDRSAHLPGWALRREYRSTYRSRLEDTEKLASGSFVGHVESGEKVIPVSMESGLARDLKLSLGDELVFDVQGVPVTAKVASLRDVEWRRMAPNFFVVFPDGALEDAPKFFIVAVHAESADDSARIQQAVNQAFPNVSAIDLGLVEKTLDGIFSKVEFVVRFMVLFTVVTGVIVLAGAVIAGRSQRLRETVLLRLIGATRSQLIQIQLVEYALLGALAAVTGGGLAVALEWLLARFLFHTPLVVPPAALVLSTAAVAGVTVLTGWLANRGVARQPPLEVLRHEG